MVDKTLQRVAVDILHDNGLPQFGHLFPTDGAADVGMVELNAYLKLLAQGHSVDGGQLKVGLEQFQHIAFAVALGHVETGRPRG